MTTIVFCLVLMLLLACCGAKKTENDPLDTDAGTEKTQQTSGESSGAPQESVAPEKPPVLTVVYGDDSIEALKGTYSWMYQNADGAFTGKNADGVYVLDAKNQMPYLSLLPPDPSNPDLPTADLHWDIAPDKITVLYWDETAWRQPDASEEEPAEEPEAHTLMIDYAVEDASATAIELKDGEYIYEIIAEWNSAEEYHGTACYGFYTVK